MRLLLWHGYLLHGSGSNIYTANVARVWRRQGHDVLLLCQEHDLSDDDFVDEAGDFTGDNDAWELRPLERDAADGRCRLIRPSIGNLLPVYVYDRYEFFTAKRFVDLTSEELDSYVQSNVSALSAAIRVHRPDGIVIGHEVMGPEIARRACELTGAAYAVKLHGSALEYAVKEQDRYLRFAESGLNAADVVVGPSRYMIDAAAQVVPGDWKERTAVVNPGCDIELFKPKDRAAGDLLNVIYVGALIPLKGIHNLLAALPLVGADLRLTVVGFGEFDGTLRRLWDAISAGDLDTIETIASGGSNGPPLTHLREFFDAGPPPGYFERASTLDVTFAGRLDHRALAPVLPDFDVLATPSVLAEAFGMVAAEAAASGVLPLVARHSGLAEVAGVLESELGLESVLSFDPTSPIEALAAGLEGLARIPPDRRMRLGRQAAAVARTHWSWDRVAEGLAAEVTRRGPMPAT